MAVTPCPAMVALLVATGLVRAADYVPIRMHPGAYRDADPIRLGAGIPLREGQVHDVRDLAIALPGGEPAPAQFEERTRYESGSLLWIWADFVAPPAEEYRLVANVANPADALSDMAVTETPTTIAVENGALEIVWSKNFAAPIGVRIARNGAAKEVASGDGGGIYLVDDQGRRAALGGDASDLEWSVETKGKLRVVLRVEGWYATQAGERVARAIVRYHIYRDTPTVKMDHAFIVTTENDRIAYKEIGVALPARKGRAATALFADSQGHTYEETIRGDGDAWVFQREYPVYNRKVSVCELGRGDEVAKRFGESANWAALDFGDGAVLVAARDFAKQFPKEFHAGDGALTVKLWSGRDGRLLDYRVETMISEWWREWFDFAGKHRDARADPYQPEAIRAANPSSVGLARGHELVFGYFAETPSVDRCIAFGALCDAPPIAFPDPRWTCRVDSRAFWPMAAKGEGGGEFQDIEEFVSAWFDEFMVPLNHFRYTGWYDFGKGPELRYFKTVENGVVNVYPVWWRLGIKNNYGFPKGVLLAWARSGDRKYYEAGRRFARWTNDYCFTHWSGGRDRRRRGVFLRAPSHAQPNWGGRGGLNVGGDSEDVTGLALFYLLTDARWAADTLEPVAENVLREFSPTGRFTGNAPDMVLSYMTGLYRVFPSPELRARCEALFQAITDPEDPGGMSREWFATRPGHYANPLYKMNRKGNAIKEYCDVFGYDDYGRKVLEKAAQTAFGYDRKVHGFPQVCTYCNYYGALNAAVCRRTGDRGAFERARLQLEGVRRLFAAYRRLPESGRMDRYFLEQLRPDPGKNNLARAYVFRDVEMPAHEGDAPAHFALYTSGAANATPFVVMPAVMGMMNDVDQRGLTDAGK